MSARKFWTLGIPRVSERRLIKTEPKVRLLKPSRGTSFGSANEGSNSEEVLWGKKVSHVRLVLAACVIIISARPFLAPIWPATFRGKWQARLVPWFIIIAGEHEAPERSVRRTWNFDYQHGERGACWLGSILCVITLCGFAPVWLTSNRPTEMFPNCPP